MEIRHFRSFLYVAQHGHFTRAAEQLGIAPPTLNRQIQDMEQELGVRLFERNQREVDLTTAGQALLIEAEQAVRQFDTAQLDTRPVRHGENGLIELGYMASAVYSGLLQAQVSRFNEAHPGLRLNIREAPMAELIAQVRGGLMDVAYVRSPVELPAELDAIALQQEGFVLALPASSRINELKIVPASCLASETFILPEQISATLEVASQGGFEPRLGPQPGSLVAVLTLVSLGKGVAMVPESVVTHIRLPQVNYRPVQECHASSWLSLLYRRSEKAPAVLRYVEKVRHE